jgi:hypothetical protein
MQQHRRLLTAAALTVAHRTGSRLWTLPAQLSTLQQQQQQQRVLCYSLVAKLLQ